MHDITVLVIKEEKLFSLSHLFTSDSENEVV